tara:strand:+ start:5124 stop:5288 length:165 start_codon:yes stop_codon:yes gene_type:complete
MSATIKSKLTVALRADQPYRFHESTIRPLFGRYKTFDSGYARKLNYFLLPYQFK